MNANTLVMLFLLDGYVDDGQYLIFQSDLFSLVNPILTFLVFFPFYKVTYFREIVFFQKDLFFEF